MGGRCVGGCSQIAQPDTPGMEGLRHKNPQHRQCGDQPCAGFLPDPPAPPSALDHGTAGTGDRGAARDRTAEPLGTGPQSSRGSGVLPSDLPATLWAARAKK